MFSLCIPTIDRYDTFLKKNLLRYINNPLVDEIVISDENGNDNNKIKRDFKSQVDSGKIKLSKNNEVLGPFLNKIKVCKMAKNEWIALIDSDNFADNNYFTVAEKYIKGHKLNNKTIIAPCFAKPNFDYRTLGGKIIKRENVKQLRDNKLFILLMNTGNYIVNKFLIDNLQIEKDMELIKKSHACDVTLFNTLLYEQLGLEMHVVKDLHYDHAFHSNSIYLKTCEKFKAQLKETNKRFERL